MSSEPAKRHNFKLFQKVYVKELLEGKVLHNADYTTAGSDENGPFMLQFDLENKQEKKKFDLKTGFYRLEYGPNSLTAKTIETQKVELFQLSSAFLKIKEQADTFYNNLDVYKKLPDVGIPRRAMLMHSPPGVGKTSTIAEVAREYIKASKISIVIWPSDVVESEDVKDFLSTKCNWDDIDLFMLVIEDLGGGADIYGSVHAKIPSSLLNFLDGMENVFKKPTFILSTTNNPDALLDSLTSRPGRFDVVMGLPLPQGPERLGFLKFFAGQYYSELNLDAAGEARFIKLSDGFAAAHLKECYIRAMLNKKSILESAEEIQAWIQKVKNGKLQSEKKTKELGFSNRFEE